MTVGWGFIGAGWIAQRAMAAALHEATNARLHSAASRDPRRAAALEPAVSLASYAAVVEDPEVDVVYVCLANHQHAEWVVRALEAGKHVLCEKPLGVDPAEAHAMTAAAAAADRLLVEAVWCQWHPRFRRLASLCSTGALGSIDSIDTAFTFPADLADTYRSEPALGGGALLDVGGYQVHAWAALLGSPAAVAIDEVEIVGGATGIDLTTRIAATIGERTRATALASFVLPEHQSLVVAGSVTQARMAGGAAFTSWREPSTLAVGGHLETFAPVDAYRLMVEAVSDRAVGGDAWLVPVDQSAWVASRLAEVGRRTS